MYKLDRLRCQVVKIVDFEEIKKLADQLPHHQRLELADAILGHHSSVTAILGGTNVVNNSVVSNSFALQLGGNVEEIFEQLKNIPQETFEELLKAIALWIAHDKYPQPRGWS